MEPTPFLVLLQRSVCVNGSSRLLFPPLSRRQSIVRWDPGYDTRDCFSPAAVLGLFFFLLLSLPLLCFRGYFSRRGKNSVLGVYHVCYCDTYTVCGCPVWSTTMIHR